MKRISYMKPADIHFDLCFETLSSQLRIEIIQALKKKPQSVLQLASAIGVEQSRLSHALQMLKDCHYVFVQPHGRQRIYVLRDDVLAREGLQPETAGAAPAARTNSLKSA